MKMADTLHPEATHHLPIFITAPGQTDILMVVTAAFLAVAVVAFGVLYFRLHSLPEHIAHKSQKVQMELVAILGLISLFTHMHIFWIAGLILAFIDLPDFGTPLRRIAGSVERIAGGEPPDETAASVEARESKPTDAAAASPKKALEKPAEKSAAAAANKKAPSHA
jgi:hypothetical protein